MGKPSVPLALLALQQSSSRKKRRQEHVLEQRAAGSKQQRPRWDFERADATAQSQSSLQADSSDDPDLEQGPGAPDHDPVDDGEADGGPAASCPGLAETLQAVYDDALASNANYFASAPALPPSTECPWDAFEETGVYTDMLDSSFSVFVLPFADGGRFLRFVCPMVVPERRPGEEDNEGFDAGDDGGVTVDVSPESAGLDGTGDGSGDGTILGEDPQTVHTSGQRHSADDVHHQPVSWRPQEGRTVFPGLLLVTCADGTSRLVWTCMCCDHMETNANVVLPGSIPDSVLGEAFVGCDDVCGHVEHLRGCARLAFEVHYQLGAVTTHMLDRWLFGQQVTLTHTSCTLIPQPQTPNPKPQPPAPQPPTIDPRP